MNGAELGANESPSAAATDQIVVPLIAAPVSSAQVNTAPPQSSTSRPRCFLYQAHKALGSRALKKIPPMPVTRFIGHLATSPRGRILYFNIPARASNATVSVAHQVLGHRVIRRQRHRIQVGVRPLRV